MVVSDILRRCRQLIHFGLGGVSARQALAAQGPCTEWKAEDLLMV